GQGRGWHQWSRSARLPFYIVVGRGHAECSCFWRAFLEEVLRPVTGAPALRARGNRGGSPLFRCYGEEKMTAPFRCQSSLRVKCSDTNRSEGLFTSLLSSCSLFFVW